MQENIESVPVDAYSKTELAKLYSFAYTVRMDVRKLMVIIKNSTGLLKELENVGYKARIRKLSPAMVRIIFGRLEYPELTAQSANYLRKIQKQKKQKSK